MSEIMENQNQEMIQQQLSEQETIRREKLQKLVEAGNDGQVSRGSAGEYQADARAGVARLSWRVSGRCAGRCRAAQLLCADAAMMMA